MHRPLGFETRLEPQRSPGCARVMEQVNDRSISFQNDDYLFQHKHLEERPARFVVSVGEPLSAFAFSFSNHGTKLINDHFPILRRS
jgi:hypothetical protein